MSAHRNLHRWREPPNLVVPLRTHEIRRLRHVVLSRAMASMSGSGSHSCNGTTAAGLPQNGREVNALTNQMGNSIATRHLHDDTGRLASPSLTWVSQSSHWSSLNPTPRMVRR